MLGIHFVYLYVCSLSQTLTPELYCDNVRICAGLKLSADLGSGDKWVCNKCHFNESDLAFNLPEQTSTLSRHFRGGTVVLTSLFCSAEDPELCQIEQEISPHNSLNLYDR